MQRYRRYRGISGLSGTTVNRLLVTHMRHQPPVFAVTHNAADGVVDCKRSLEAN